MRLSCDFRGLSIGVLMHLRCKKRPAIPSPRARKWMARLPTPARYATVGESTALQGSHFKFQVLGIEVLTSFRSECILLKLSVVFERVWNEVDCPPTLLTLVWYMFAIIVRRVGEKILTIVRKALIDKAPCIYQMLFSKTDASRLVWYVDLYERFSISRS